MPYRHAHWYVFAVFPLAGLAFWPSYFARFSTAGAEFHAHGITASMWVALLAFQSWTIQSGRRALHRSAGLMSLALFPLFLAGGVSIFIWMARRFALEVSPFHVAYAPRLAWIDVVAVSGLALFYYLALKHRRKVHLHAGYLLATPLFLLPPILSRLSPFVPGLAVGGPEEMYKIGYGVHLANLITIAIALMLARRAGRHGRPFLAAAGLTMLTTILFETVGPLDAWRALFARVSDVPVLPAVAAATAAGVTVAWAGWTAGKTTPSAARAQPA